MELRHGDSNSNAKMGLLVPDAEHGMGVCPCRGKGLSQPRHPFGR